MKKPVKIVVALLLIFGLTITSLGGENNSVKAATAPKGGYVSATTVYSGTGQSQQVAPTRTVDMFMNVNDANAYAAKLNSGWKTSIGWLGASFIPGIGTYLGTVGAVDTISTQKAASDILKLTSKNKKVHVTLAFGIFVKEWNGLESAIKTSAPPSKTTNWGGITAITKTTINKKEIKR